MFSYFLTKYFLLNTLSKIFFIKNSSENLVLKKSKKVLSLSDKSCFFLKESFNKKHDLSDKDRTFFDFFNTKFSEEFLMKKILDKVFNKKYFVKKYENINKSFEPDYYIRHNKRIFLFENKDVLIRKDIKSSGDIDKILNVFKNKFFEIDGK